MGELEKFLNETIRKAVKDSMDEVLDDVYEMVRLGQMKDVLTTNEVMELTGWSRRTVQYMRDNRRIDFIQNGRKILYPTKKLYQFFEDNWIERWEEE